MLRNLLGILAALLAINVVVFVGFFGGGYLLGAERVLQPGSYDASALWLVVSSLIGLTAAFCGGVACQSVARDVRASRALAALIFALGIAAWVMGSGATEPPPRPPGETGFAAVRAAAEHGREPLATRILNPLLGIAGVLIGAAFVARRQPSED